MRVLEIVADGSPGGGTTHVLQILRDFRDRCSIGLVTQRDSYLLEEAESLGVPIFGVDFFRSRLDLRVPLRLLRIVREFGPRVVHVHGGRAAFFYSLASAGVPAVYTVHGYHFVHKSAVARRLAMAAERRAVRKFKEIVFVSEHDLRMAKAHGILPAESRTNVIYNGITLGEMPEPDGDASKHIGFVGRLERQKDPFLFLDMMEQLPEYTATMTGGGRLEDEVRSEIERRGLFNVEMAGALSHAETLSILPSFDAVVMTSLWEGMPLLSLEAMWAGVPVVAVNVGGLGEIIEDGESGILVEERSAVELARAVRRMEEDRELRERVIENGRRRVCERFSEERMLDGIWKVYERVADG